MKVSRILPAFSFLFLTLLLATEARPQAPAAPAARQQLVWLDTDIGDDIDDAFALGLIVKSPELHLLGVSTTFGDTAMRAKIVERYLAAAGRGDVPVGAGPATAAKNVLTQASYGRHAHVPPAGDGVERMLGAIRAHPGQVTLIAIGPLSTVGAAIARDRVTFRKLKRVILMGGSVERGYDGAHGARQPPSPEWNILCDPKGAQALFTAGVPIFMMPLDSTQIHLETAERERLFAAGTPVSDQITLLYHQWMAGSDSHSPTPTLFDPVTVAYAVHPELCPVKPMHIDVDEKGMTLHGPGAANAEVCLQSDERGFLSLLEDRLTH